MSEIVKLGDLFIEIADAIRDKDGTTEPIQASTFPERILTIPSGGDEWDQSVGDPGTIYVASYMHHCQTEINIIHQGG